MRTVLTLVLIATAGFMISKLRTEWVRAPILVQPIRGANTIGFITRLEIRPDASNRVTLRVIKIEGVTPQDTPRYIRVIVRTKQQKNVVTKANLHADSLAPTARASPHPLAHLTTGTAVRLKARLSPPPRPTVPGGYDFGRAAFYQGIGAIGFATSPPEVLSKTMAAPWIVILTARIQSFRRIIGNRIEQALPGEQGIMANALMTGERSGITKETNELYRDAGIFHILSISGLHMAIMGGSVFLALRFLLAAIPPIALNFPIKKWSAAGAAIATFGYLLISGGAHPTVRSFIMILIMFVAIMLDRPALALRNVVIAALLILAVMPESLFDAGFQLSFAAVVALVAAYETYQARQIARRRLGFIQQRSHGVWGSLQAVWLFALATVATTLIAGLATAPLTAYHFHASQQYSVLTNLIAIPVSNLIVMPAALAAFVVMPIGLETWPLWLMGIGIEIMTWSAREVAALPGAVITVSAFSAWTLLAMVFGALWLCIWRRLWRLTGLVVMLVGIALASQSSRPDIFINERGNLVAFRKQDGELIATRTRRGSFVLQKWLESDGDQRSPNVAMHPPRKSTGKSASDKSERLRRALKKEPLPMRCDLVGCIGHIGKQIIAMPRSPNALVDDCRRADLLVLTFPKPKNCQTTAEVFDVHRLRRDGVHTIYTKSNGRLRIVTVEQMRGVRPWTRRGKARDRLLRSWTRRQLTQQAQTVATSEDQDGNPQYWLD